MCLLAEKKILNFCLGCSDNDFYSNDAESWKFTKKRQNQSLIFTNAYILRSLIWGKSSASLTTNGGFIREDLYPDEWSGGLLLKSDEKKRIRWASEQLPKCDKKNNFWWASKANERVGEWASEQIIEWTSEQVASDQEASERVGKWESGLMIECVC